MTARPDDILIVGGGVIGCALAAELATRGQRVTVIERGEPGLEASGAAAGMLTPQAEAHRRDGLFDLALESRNLYPQWAGALFEETGIDVGYRRTGILQCVFGEPGGQRLFPAYAWQCAAGLPVEEYSPAQLRRCLGGRLSPEVGEAVFFPDDAVVDPRRLMLALALAARRRGVRLRTGTAARRFLVRDGVCRGVETEEGPIEAKAVVDAAGAWAAFDRDLAPPPPVAPVRGQIVELSIPDQPLPSVVSSDEVYLVPRPDGTVLLGSTLELVGFRKGVTAEAVQRLIAAAVRLVPSLKAARFVSAWSGLRPGTTDGLPVLGRSPVPGLFYATGHYRNGILLAPVTARILADLLTGGSERDLSAFSISRFAGSLGAV
jgi:glycine oxidase